MFQVRLKFTSQAYCITVIISYLKTTKNATKNEFTPPPKKKKIQKDKNKKKTKKKQKKDKNKNTKNNEQTKTQQNKTKNNNTPTTHKKNETKKEQQIRKKKQIPSQSKSLHGLSITVSNHTVLRSECAKQNVISYIYNHNTST